MSGLIYFNGILLHEMEVAIPVKDRSYLYGEGLFETLRATGGFVPFLPEHLERFFQAFKVLDFEPDLSPAKLEFAVYQTLLHNHLKEAYLRVQLSRENTTFGSLEPGDQYNLMVVTQSLPKGAEKSLKEGVQAVLFPEHQVLPHPLSGVKSTDYAINLRAKAFAKQSGAHEALFADPKGRLVEGASSNVFFWNGKAWVTPSLGQGALPGVMRRVLISLMEVYQLPYEERTVSLEELGEAEEAILTNAIWEILPLTRWEGKEVGDGKVGPQTRQLQEWLAEEIQYRQEKNQV